MYSVGTIDDIRTNSSSGSEFADLAGSLGTRTTLNARLLDEAKSGKRTKMS